MNYVDKISINGVAHEIRDTEARKQIAQNADAINALAERVDSTPPQKNDDQVTQTGAVVAVDVSAGVEIKVDGDTTETVTLIHQGKNFLPSGLENAPTKTEIVGMAIRLFLRCSTARSQTLPQRIMCLNLSRHIRKML